MDVYTYSEARQNFSRVLDKAESTGKVLIRRKDGRTYDLCPGAGTPHRLASGCALHRGGHLYA